MIKKVLADAGCFVMWSLIVGGVMLLGYSCTEIAVNVLASLAE